MRRTHEHGTKARLSFSGRPHAPVNMVDSKKEVNIAGEKITQEVALLLRSTALYFVRQVFENP